MKNFRFKITVEAVENGQFSDPILIKTIEHTLRDENLSQFSRLLNNVPFDTTATFNGLDISHVLQDARENIGMAGAIQFANNEPQVGYDFRYVDSVAIGDRVFGINVTFTLKAIEDLGDIPADAGEVGFQYTMLELLKGRVKGMSVGAIGRYHLIGMVSKDRAGENGNIRMVLYRPTKQLIYLKKHLLTEIGTPVFVPGEVVFQMTGDRDWEVLPRFPDDQFKRAIEKNEIEVVANVVVPYSYVEERVGKEEIAKWIKD